jgi:hypothetical protein
MYQETHTTPSAIRTCFISTVAAIASHNLPLLRLAANDKIAFGNYDLGGL